MRQILIAKKNCTKSARECFAMPWKHDAACFNFKEPNEFVPISEVRYLKALSEVGTLVVKADLRDYSFISEMKNLKQLYIYTGCKIKDLSFLRDLLFLEQICILHSEINSLEGLNDLMQKKNDAIQKGQNQQWLYTVEGIFLHTDSGKLENAAFDAASVYCGEIWIDGRR